MYYLRSTAAADAIKFTVDKAQMQQPSIAEATVSESEVVLLQQVVAIASESQQAIPYEQLHLADYDQKRSDMACSLDNPDACEACGS